jgi:membrane-associated phospholipid phosphatase
MNPSAPAATGRIRVARCALIVVALGLWFWTQNLIGAKRPDHGGHGIGDAVLTWTAPINAWLNRSPQMADGLLIASSLGIDALGVFLVAATIFGRTSRPFIGLMALFALRQGCQLLISLPPPEGMIWRDPGFPSLLVTYGVANDLFFSGHTAMAVFGAWELARTRWRFARSAAIVLAAFEIATVLVLRAHYTMDVFAGAMAAIAIAMLAARIAGPCDAMLRSIAGSRKTSLPEALRPAVLSAPNKVGTGRRMARVGLMSACLVFFPASGIPRIEAAPTAAEARARAEKMQQLLSARRETAAKLLAIQEGRLIAGVSTASELLQAMEILLQAEMECNDTRAGKIAAVTKHLESIRDFERLTARRLEIGRASPSDVAQAHYWRLDAELELHRIKIPARAGKKAHTEEMQRLLNARRERAGIALEASSKRLIAGMSSADEVSEACRRYRDAEVEASPSAEAKMAAYANHVAKMQELERDCIRRVEIGVGRPTDIFLARHWLLTGKLELLRFQAAGRALKGALEEQLQQLHAARDESLAEMLNASEKGLIAGTESTYSVIESMRRKHEATMESSKPVNIKITALTAHVEWLRRLELDDAKRIKIGVMQPGDAVLPLYWRLTAEIDLLRLQRAGATGKPNLRK